ncbi:MAG: 6,7-dimethyl-8-ribityllumazine synthase [Planctomycetota bacterium]
MANPTTTLLKPLPPGESLRVCLLVSRYNQWITDPLREGAISAFNERAAEITSAELVIAEAPGAYELPALANTALALEDESAFDAIVCLGCIIRGETAHDRIIADAIVQGLTQLTIETAVPIGLGILTVESADQAEARAGGTMGNKGAEAMNAALDTLAMQTALADLA